MTTIQSVVYRLGLSLLFFSLVFCLPGYAATPVVVSPQQVATVATPLTDTPADKAEVRDLVSRLDDNAVRALLIQRLDAVAEAQTSSSNTTALEVVADGFAAYTSSALRALMNMHTVPGILDKARQSLGQALQPAGWDGLFLTVLLAILLGIGAERWVAFAFRKRKQQLIDAVSTTLWGILRILYTRLSFDVLGVLAFSLVSHVVLANYYPKGSLGNQLASVVTATLVATGLGYVISRFFFAPQRPDLRICNTSDQRAARLTWTYSLLAGFIVFVHNIYGLFLRIGSDDYADGYAFIGALGFFLNLSMYAAAVGVIWLNRHSLSEVLRENKKRVTLAIGDAAPVNLSWFASHWPVIAIILVVAKYFLVEVVINYAGVGHYSSSGVYITFILIFLWPGIDANVSLWAWKSVTIPEDESVAAGKARRSMQQGLLRVGRVIVVGSSLYLLARLWGLNILDLAASGLGAQVAGGLLEILLIVLFAYMAWELVSVSVDYWLAQETGETAVEEDGAGEIGGVGLSRVATVLPIMQKTAKFLIVLVSIIMILDNWGVNIGPILAGAGVLGLAIGFGAQTLVKDIVSGLFFLADDAFRVGEYIDVGGTMGNVEKISLRSLRLRHHRGLVHTIPYGEIPKLTNYSRDWVIMKLRFRVPFDTDINKIKKIFKKIGNDLLTHPELGADFLQPFKSQGVAEVDDNGIVVRGKFMAKPGKQFMIRKEVYVRVQKALEEAGIPFARKQVIVHIPGMDKDHELSQSERRAIAGAASEAAENEVLPTVQGKKPAD